MGSIGHPILRLITSYSTTSCIVVTLIYTIKSRVLIALLFSLYSAILHLIIVPGALKDVPVGHQSPAPETL